MSRYPSPEFAAELAFCKLGGTLDTTLRTQGTSVGITDCVLCGLPTVHPYMCMREFGRDCWNEWELHQNKVSGKLWGPNGLPETKEGRTWYKLGDK